MFKWFSTLMLLFALNYFSGVNCDDEKYVGDYSYHEYQHAFGSSSSSSDSSSSSSDSSPSYSGYSGYSGYSYPRYQYGCTGIYYNTNYSVYGYIRTYNIYCYGTCRNGFFYCNNSNYSNNYYNQPYNAYAFSQGK